MTDYRLRPGPYRFTPRALAMLGVEMASDPYDGWLRCTRCGQTWSPNVRRGGLQPRGYWRCPRECNSGGRWAAPDESEEVEGRRP